MAYNLAVSLKKYIKCNITLLYEDEALMGVKRDIFDKLIKPKYEDYTDNQVINPFKLKTRLYNYIEQDSLYLDVDMFANNELLNFVDKVQDFDLYVPKVDKLHWAQTDKPHQPVNTSVIWVKKTKANEKIFIKVANLYNKPIPHKKIGSFYPDEIPFSLALAEIELPILKAIYAPEKRYIFKDMLTYAFLCMAGQPTQAAISDYDRMAKAQGLQFNLPYYKFNRRAKTFQ